MAQNNQNNPAPPINTSKIKKRQIVTFEGGVKAAAEDTLGSSDMYKGAKKTYLMAEAVGGVMTQVGAKAIAMSHYDTMTKSLNYQSLNGSIDLIQNSNANLGTKLNYVSFDRSPVANIKNFNISMNNYAEDLIKNNASIFGADSSINPSSLTSQDSSLTSQDKSALAYTSRLKINAQNLNAASKGGDVFISVNGHKLQVDSSKLQLDGGSSLNAMAKDFKFSAKSEADLICANKKAISNALEACGIHNFDSMSRIKKNKLMRNLDRDNTELGRAIKELITAHGLLGSIGKDFKGSDKSKKNTVRGAKSQVRNMFKDCDLVRGATISAYTTKLTKKALNLLYRTSVKTTGKVIKRTGKIVEGAANLGFRISSSGSYYQQVFGNVASNARKVQNTGQKITEHPQKKAEKNKQKYQNKQERKSLKKKAKQDRRQTRKANSRGQRRRDRWSNNLAGTRFGKTKVGGWVSGKVKNGFVGTVLGAFKKLINLPGIIMHKIKAAIICVVLAMAALLIAVMLIIWTVAGAAIIVGNIASSVTSFFEGNEGELSLGQQVVNELRSKSLKEISDKKAVSQNGFMGADGTLYEGQHISTVSGTTISFIDDTGASVSQQDYYNIKEIMCLAEIHFDGDYDTDSYMQYCKDLWAATHSSQTTYSAVQECDATSADGCTNWGTYTHSSADINAGKCTNYEAGKRTINDEELTAAAEDAFTDFKNKKRGEFLRLVIDAREKDPSLSGADAQAKVKEDKIDEYKEKHKNDEVMDESLSKCLGHEGCLGHVYAEVSMQTASYEQTIQTAKTLKSYLHYSNGLLGLGKGWTKKDDGTDYDDGIDYDSAEVREQLKDLMDIDWKEEYGVSLGAGSFEANADTEKAIYDYLYQCGFTPAGIAGVMGNIYCESGYNPLANNNDTYLGICQWSPTRYSALVSYCESLGLDPLSLDGQIQYMVIEMQTSYSTCYTEMQGNGAYEDVKTDPQAAACLVAAQFEGCIAASGTPDYGKPENYYPRYSAYYQNLSGRKEKAQEVYDNYLDYTPQTTE